MKAIFIIYVAGILMLVLLPINSKESTINHTYIFKLRLDYLFHALLFVPWMFLKPKGSFKISSFIWLIAGFIFALASESFQYFIPYRAFNINDLFANLMGVSIGLFLLALIKIRINQNPPDLKNH